VKFRISSEWVILAAYGNYLEQQEELLKIPVYNYPQCLVFEIAPQSVSYKELYIQSAMLYTSCDGARRLRIHNLKLTTTESLSEIYKNGNCDALVNILVKKSLKHMVSTDKPEEGSRYLENQCKAIMQNCRKIWGKQPEKLEFFCASVLGVLKHPVLMNKGFGCNFYIDNMTLDLFFYYKYLFESLPSEATGVLSYPRMYPIHLGYESALNLTYKSLETTGAYLLDTGIEIFVWIGKAYLWI
jgi:protein transport protein SEC24